MLVAIIIRQVLEDSILGMGTIKNSWMQLSNPENKIHEEVVKVEISSEGLKALKDEEKIAFLQESLQTAGSLHRIEQGSDIRLKYGYVSAGELMKEKAPEEYEKYSFLLTKGFERNDENILLDATRYMLQIGRANLKKMHLFFKTIRSFVMIGMRY